MTNMLKIQTVALLPCKPETRRNIWHDRYNTIGIQLAALPKRPNQ